MITAIVFDFDGVLADSEPLHLETYQEVLSHHAMTLTREDYYAHYLGYDDEGVFTRVAGAHGRAVDRQAVARLIEEKTRVFDAIINTRDVLFPGAADCVARMAEAFPIGIASGALKHEIQAILGRHHLAHHFKFIVASGDTPASKPEPDPYLRAAALHGAAPACCLAIEDSRWGIESAKSAGLACIGITHTYSASQLTAADLVVTSLDLITPALVHDTVR